MTALPGVRIVDLTLGATALIEQTAHTLIAGFRASDVSPHAWPTLASALAEVQDSLQPGRISRLALATEGQRSDDADDNSEGTVVGWIGGVEQYHGHVWELHPLVVRPEWQGRGIGRALVLDFEALVRARDAQTITLGTDDETGATTLSDCWLYEDVPAALAQITCRPGRRHPLEFYRRLGYTVVGVVPDANGPGRPDILMAKPLHAPATERDRQDRQ